LLINGRHAPLVILKNIKVTIKTEQYVDHSSPLTKVFEGIKFGNSASTVVDFQVPPFLKNVSVQIESEVYNVMSQKNESLMAERNFAIRNQYKGNKFCELFLQKEVNGDFWVSVLGKNGEPRSNIKVQIDVVHPWFVNGGQMKPVTLTSDKDGRVKLGNLKNVIKIKCNASSLGVHQSWYLGKHIGG
jgi:hypothetical protein